jgi:hypothetical protein
MSDAEIITQARIQLMRGTDPTDVADYMLDALTERSWHEDEQDDTEGEAS